MMFLFFHGNKSFGRECALEDAIDTARRLVLDDGAEEVILSVLIGGAVVKLGTYQRAEDPRKYVRTHPNCLCVESRPAPHRIPKSEYYNVDAWRLTEPGEVKDLMDKIRRGRPRKS